MGAELFIAGKYLRAKRKEGFISLITLLSVAGVILGVMALVVVIAVMSGSETEFRNRILGLEPHILAMNYSGHFTPDTDMENKIRQTPGDKFRLQRSNGCRQIEQSAQHIKNEHKSQQKTHLGLKFYF